MKNIARNAPCPCGSGKKYKQCCLKKDKQQSPDVLWQKLREVNDKLVGDIMKYAAAIFGEEALFEAWDEFVNFNEDELFDFNSPQNQAFFPWYHFNWRPEGWIDEEDDEFEEDDYNIPTIAQSYLNRYGNRLSEMERRLIELKCAAEFSFHEVLDCHPGKGFMLKDILLESEVYVSERSASSGAQKGDILFAKIIQYDDIGLIMGCGPVLIPPKHKPLIIDLRAFIREEEGPITLKTLFEWDFEIRDLYFSIYNAMHTPPQMNNTDGDPLVFHDLYFKIITTPQKAFDRLKSLALDIPEDELLEEGEYDEDGKLETIEFRWLKKGFAGSFGGDYTTLGQITIDKGEIIVSVNSENRAKRIRNEIEKRLKGQVVHQTTEVKPFEVMMEEAKNSPTPTPELPEMTPEMEAAIEKMLASHWKQWVDENIPTLGGKTPRQAIKNKDGREKVIALLDEFERMENRQHSGPSQLKYIRQIRKKLGL